MTRAKAGRASYLAADKLEGYDDPGAEGMAHLQAWRDRIAERPSAKA